MQQPIPERSGQANREIDSEIHREIIRDQQLAAVFEEHQLALKRFLWVRVRLAEEVSDLLQETFERFQRHQHTVDLANARNFLFTIARNLVIDRARHLKVSEVDREFDVETLLDPLPSLEEQVISAESVQQLTQAIALLPPQCQRVFVMRKIHQTSQKSIAEKLGISVSTVEKHVAMGMKLCRQHLTSSQ